MGGGTMSADGIGAIMTAICQCLDHQKQTTFTLTYDLRFTSTANLDIVLGMARNDGKTAWRLKCLQRCIGWKIVVRTQESLQASKETLDPFFKDHPPMCCIYLESDNGGAAENDSIIYEPIKNTPV